MKKLAIAAIAAILALIQKPANSVEYVVEQCEQNSQTELAQPAIEVEQRCNDSRYIPIILYHKIRQRPLTYIEITPELFNEELKWLANNNFVSVSLEDIVNGTVDIPKGKHPVGITADDHFENPLFISTYLRFLQKYPGFKMHATFFINGNKIDLNDEEKFKRRIEMYKALGIDIQAHSYSHCGFRRITRLKALLEFRLQEQEAKVLGLEPFRFFAYPFGNYPRNSGVFELVKQTFSAAFAADGREPSMFRRCDDNGKPTSLHKIPRIDGRDFNALKNLVNSKRSKLYTQE